MKKWVMFSLVVCVLIGLLGIAVAGYIQWQQEQRKIKADELYAAVKSELNEFPSLPESYQYIDFYYCDGENQYMIYQNGDQLLSGVRTQDGETTYYADRNSPVFLAVREPVYALLNDPQLTYSYEIAGGGPLPLWVYPSEPYLNCSRPGFSDHGEIMVCHDMGQGSYIRWNIAQSTEDVTLFLFIHEKTSESNDKPIYIYGWGYLPDELGTSVSR